MLQNRFVRLTHNVFGFNLRLTRNTTIKIGAHLLTYQLLLYEAPNLQTSLSDRLHSVQEGIILMLENTNKPGRTLNEILDSLLIKEEPYDTFYQTRSREDYDRLLDAALSGDLEGFISVGHSAIYRDKIRVTPPSAEIAN